MVPTAVKWVSRRGASATSVPPFRVMRAVAAARLASLLVWRLPPRMLSAEKVLAVLPKRFAKYGLALHPDKTRLVSFMRPGQQPDSKERGPRQKTFDLLGFRHSWGRSLRGGLD